MTRRASWALAVGITSLLVVLAVLTFLPQLLNPNLADAQLQAVPSAETRIQLQQAQAQLQNSVRSTLLQAVAGLLVIAGAFVTWRQVQVNRDGQITDRFTRSVEQIGGDNVDVRIGGIYALERVAKNSVADRPQVQYILAAFIRGHAPWSRLSADSPEPVDKSLPWLDVRLPDIQAALHVIGRRPPSPDTMKLYLSRVDLRRANLHGAKLTDAQVRHTNLARSWLVAATFDRSDLCYTDFRQTRAIGTRFVDSVLRGASFHGADVAEGDFRRADLRAADMRSRNLDRADLVGALADSRTSWPDGFDVRAAGVVTENATPEPD